MKQKPKPKTHNPDMRTILNHILPLILLIALVFVSCKQGTPDENISKKGPEGNRIVETGELAAVNSRSFVMQRYGRHWYSMKITGILNHGAEVKAGDSIIQLDPTEVNKYILDRESQLETQLAVLEKLHVDQQNRQQELDSRLKTETATFDLKKLELQASQFETERLRKIKELEFKQAQISLNKIKSQIEHNRKIASYTLKIERIKKQRLEEEIRTAKQILPSLTLRTPISGIFQIAWNNRTRSFVKIGDEIHQGNFLGNVPDLTWMKVNTTVNETDFLRVKTGQQVIVRLDALPDVKFEGEVAFVGKLCRPKSENSRQKVFEVEVNILKPDNRLKPGMTVSCEFIEK
jgi:multidrug efflux pump subunit AcrA (membrane-fusion protein)